MIKQSEEFCSNVFKHTHYEEELQNEATDVFSNIEKCISTMASSPDGLKLIQKYSVLASTISTQATFNDMVKIIWRIVKTTMSGGADDKLLLFILGIGTIVHSVKKTRGDNVNQWVAKVELWLGDQLTIGGKGVTGDGEGSVSDRIRRFFSTPYLHDFD